MLDKLKPITHNDITALSEELRAVMNEKDDSEREYASMKKKPSSSDRAEFNEKISSLNSRASSLEKDLAYALEYLKSNGNEYGVSPDEDAQPFAVCLGCAYGYAVFRASGNKYYVEEENGQQADDVCADFQALVRLSELPEAEQSMILRHIFEDKGGV